MLEGFWKQFKKFKYNGCSISLVPAARLPADPLQVSYAAGEATIDPRDMLNPIMFHGCHGDNMGSILNGLYSGQAGTGDIMREFSDSTEQNIVPADLVGNDFIEALYYKALTDTTWRKAHPQQGFRKSGLRPMVHRVVASAPFGVKLDPAGARQPDFKVAANLGITGIPSIMDTDDSGGTNPVTGIYPQYNGLSLMTSRLEPLGWQDTYSVHMDRVVEQEMSSNDAQANATMADILASPYLNAPNTVPKVFMGMIMLPPAYKTEQYYRLIIEHNISFAKFRGASMATFKEELINDSGPVFNFN